MRGFIGVGLMLVLCGPGRSEPPADRVHQRSVPSFGKEYLVHYQHPAQNYYLPHQITVAPTYEQYSTPLPYYNGFQEAAWKKPAPLYVHKNQDNNYQKHSYPQEQKHEEKKENSYEEKKKEAEPVEKQYQCKVCGKKSAEISFPSVHYSPAPYPWKEASFGFEQQAWKKYPEFTQVLYQNKYESNDKYSYQSSERGEKNYEQEEKKKIEEPLEKHYQYKEEIKKKPIQVTYIPVHYEITTPYPVWGKTPYIGKEPSYSFEESGWKKTEGGIQGIKTDYVSTYVHKKEDSHGEQSKHHEEASEDKKKHEYEEKHQHYIEKQPSHITLAPVHYQLPTPLPVYHFGKEGSFGYEQDGWKKQEGYDYKHKAEYILPYIPKREETHQNSDHSQKYSYHHEQKSESSQEDAHKKDGKHKNEEEKETDNHDEKYKKEEINKKTIRVTYIPVHYEITSPIPHFYDLGSSYGHLGEAKRFEELYAKKPEHSYEQNQEGLKYDSKNYSYEERHQEEEQHKEENHGGYNEQKYSEEPEEKKYSEPLDKPNPFKEEGKETEKKKPQIGYVLVPYDLTHKLPIYFGKTVGHETKENEGAGEEKKSEEGNNTGEKIPLPIIENKEPQAAEKPKDSSLSGQNVQPQSIWNFFQKKKIW